MSRGRRLAGCREIRVADFFDTLLFSILSRLLERAGTCAPSPRTFSRAHRIEPGAAVHGHVLTSLPGATPAENGPAAGAAGHAGHPGAGGRERARAARLRADHG